jgi:ribonuclease Z
MDITLLGTGSPLPDPNRAGPATLIEAGNTSMLVDAGRGVQMRMTAAGVLPPMLSGIFLTHLHSDHITGLNDLITAHWVLTPTAVPQRIWGPPGTRQVVDAILAMLAPDIRYRIAHHGDLTWEPNVDVTEVAGGDVTELGDLTVRVGATDHRPVEPTLAYRFEHEGKTVVVAGDTVPCAALDALCAGADALVQTAIRRDLLQNVPQPRIQDIIEYHSSVEQAAQTAAKAGVGKLILTHYVPPPAPGAEEQWISLAEKHFSGEVTVADDLAVVSV